MAESDLISRQVAIDGVKRLSLGETDAMRLAMRIEDYLERLQSAQPEPIKINIDDFNKEGWERLKKEWENTPITVLPVQPEIIRCKDCKNSEHWYRDRRRCFLWSDGGVSVFDDGFCSYGERREDTDESVIAEWICLGHRSGFLKHPYSIDYKCSNCGYEEYTLLSYPPERCPKCRAYMKGKLGYERAEE